MHLLALSAFRLPLLDLMTAMLSCLNAPSGAQCFPTVSWQCYGATRQSQCTFWCSVLSDQMGKLLPEKAFKSQCTFWCSVLSDSAFGAVE